MQSSADQIAHELQVILTSYLGEDVGVTSETDLIADLKLESVQVMEFVVEIEDHYDIAIDLETLSRVRTVADMAAVVMRTKST